MQTEASIFPVVQLHVHRIFTSRKSKSDSKPKKLSPCRNILFSSNKKCLNPLPGAPYKGSIKQQSLSDEQKSSNKSILGQRVMSAKMLRFKQLQNQLADAHYHLNELANENRLLKALQKRQDSALKRYEGTNAELPRLINSHHEELRVLQTKYKKLKELHKDTCNILKEKENELYTVNSQNKHLLQLSKDRHLEEREKLQLQLSDMNHKLQQQQDTIQLLHRKLALETKSLKHQLHIEISKHKETQKNLQETIQKLKTLECLLDNREKRLYYNGQLPIYTKGKNLGSHSLISLKNTSTSNSIKISSRSKKDENDMSRNNLLSYDTLESNDEEKVAQTTNNINDHSVYQLKSETMASLQQIRKFRLERSPSTRKSARSMDDLRLKFKDLEKETRDNENFIDSVDYKTMLERDGSSNDKSESSKLRKLFSRIKSHNSQKFQKQLRDEFEYSSGESENASEHHVKSYIPDIAQKSRDLHTRLINSTDDTSDTLDDITKRNSFRYNEENGEELNTRLAKDSALEEHLYKRKLKVLHRRNTDFYDSDSDDSEEKVKDTNGDSSEYKADDFRATLSKCGKENSSKSIVEANRTDCSNPKIEDQSIIERLEDAELQRISSDAPENVQSEKNLAVPRQIKTKKMERLGERHSLERNEDNSFTISSKKATNDEVKYSGGEPVYSDMSHDKIYRDTLKQNSTYKEANSLPNVEQEEDEERSQQTRRKDSTTSHLDDYNKSPTHDLKKEYSTSKNEEMSNLTEHSDESTVKENETNKINTETQGNLNASEAKDGDTLSSSALASHSNEQSNDGKADITSTKETNDKKKINYSKEKLLATMKAIDDNENIEFLSQGYKNYNAMNRMQITENLYRGLPAHSRTKRDTIKDIFEDNHRESKVRGNCSKSH